MQPFTRNEVFRTAHRYIDNWKPSPFGYLSNRDKNEMCISCKNENTEVITDKAYLKVFDEFYKGVVYKAMYCSCCGAVFSYYKL